MEWIVPPQVAWKGSPFTFVSELFGKSWLPRQGCLLFLQHLEVKALEDSLSFYGLSQNWMPNIRDTGDVFKIHVSASKESVISLALRVNQGLHYHLPGISNSQESWALSLSETCRNHSKISENRLHCLWVPSSDKQHLLALQTSVLIFFCFLSFWEVVSHLSSNISTKY